MQQDRLSKARNTSNWSTPTTDDEANRRAAGRRRYNLLRQLDARNRRRMIVEFWSHKVVSPFEPGGRARLADMLGVHRSTITRDMKILLEECRLLECPTCGHPLEMVEVRELERRGVVKVTAA
jgi:hypothetical protein